MVLCRRILPVAVLALWACAPLTAKEPPPPAARKPTPANADVNALLGPVRKKYNLPALAAAVVTSKGLVVAGAVGVRKRGTDAAVTVDDQFHLGSETKAMTAAVIAGLVEEGKLKWDDTLGHAFPGLARSMTPELRKVTLTQLLTHHAGLRANAAGGWSVFLNRDSTRSQRQDVLKSIAGDKLESEPGTKFHYSNLGYVLAGHMAEKAADATWEELMAKRLFKPLGMRSAGFGPMGRRGKVEQPWQHSERGTPIGPGPLADNRPVMGPAGTVHCSLPDWARFVADQLRGARGGRGLLRPASYKKLHTSPYADTFYTVGGWAGRAKDERAGGLLLVHDGSNTMSFASAWVAPRRNFAVLVATNQGGPDAKKACHEARDVLLRKYLKPR